MFVNQLILYIIPLILTRTSGTRAVPAAPLFHSLMHLLWCLSAVLQHNTLSGCVRKRWNKAPVHSFCCEDDNTQCCVFLKLHWINNLVYNKWKHFIFIQNTVKPHRPLSQVFPEDGCLSSRPKLHFQVGFERIRKIKNGDIKNVNTYTFASRVTSTYFWNTITVRGHFSLTSTTTQNCIE